MAIDHCGLCVPKADFDAVVAFYLAALAPLGYKEAVRFPIGEGVSVVGMGVEDGHADWWISGTNGDKPASFVPHVAFTASDRKTVEAFYKAAIKAEGAKDNGAPGVRPQYHAHYYGAFVVDPVGTNVEAVCHQPSE